MIEKVIKILAEQFMVDADTITEDTRLADDLGADSVDVAELAMELENEFGLPEPQDGDELPTFVTVRDVIHYLESLLD